ncbi:hypothetical protein QVD17_00673 [Tagetes erecta]|uniref:Uncharacterized protein n=1 Tax=Tagetes erecta TaxID=13708 RepID=A0AAD8L8A1_TARER|nr:hypothetical protein QVD17_00673 [Tagetes erecta]
MTYLTQYYDRSVLSLLIYPYASSFEAFDENGKHIVNRSEYNNWKCVEMEKKLKMLRQLNHHRRRLEVVVVVVVVVASNEDGIGGGSDGGGYGGR